MSLLDFFTDHTFRTTLIGAVLVGLVAGALGTFVYLRRQSMISDVISHSALPGALTAFLILTGLSLNGRNMLVLMVGAVVTGTLAVFLTQWVPRISVVDASTAMAVVLSMFFGIGMLLMQYISRNPIPNKGGVGDYLFGNAATLTRADVRSAAIIGVISVLIIVLFFKVLTLQTFDHEQARIQGFNSAAIDGLFFATVAIATVIGVKSVGLVLMVAFVITPPAIARQWTRSVGSMVVISALVGATGSAIGTYLSITHGPLPTGPVIVLVLFAMLALTLAFSPRARKVAA
ncbi:MAG: metal ABC transporter permease [Arcanobacterium sp.]